MPSSMRVVIVGVVARVPWSVIRIGDPYLDRPPPPVISPMDIDLGIAIGS